jgi:hypothetical protein
MFLKKREDVEIGLIIKKCSKVDVGKQLIPLES